MATKTYKSKYTGEAVDEGVRQAYQSVQKLTTDGTFVYSHMGETQGEIIVNSVIVNDGIVQRNNSGDIIVNTNTSNKSAAVSKEYVDGEITSSFELISEESERAETAENNLKTLIISETNRAINEENQIKGQLTHYFDTFVSGEKVDGQFSNGQLAYCHQGSIIEGDGIPSTVIFNFTQTSNKALYIRNIYIKYLDAQQVEKEYNYVFISKIFSANNQTQELEGINWLLSDSNNVNYFGYSSLYGQQIGSGTLGIKNCNLTTTDFGGCTIKQIKITTCGASSTNCKLSITVAGDTWLYQEGTTSESTSYPLSANDATAMATFTYKDGSTPGTGTIINYTETFLKKDNNIISTIDPEEEILYVCLNDNRIYRYDGIELIEVSKVIELGTTEGTAYDGGKANSNFNNILYNNLTFKGNKDFANAVTMSSGGTINTVLDDDDAIVNKKYVGDTFVSKQTTTDNNIYAYVYDKNEQKQLQVGSDYYRSKIVCYDSNNEIYLPNTPTQSCCAANRQYVDDAIIALKKNSFKLVDIIAYPTRDDFLKSNGEEGYVYLYPINTADTSKGYYQYIWETGTGWISLGTTVIDLNNYLLAGNPIDMEDNEITNIEFVTFGQGKYRIGNLGLVSSNQDALQIRNEDVNATVSYINYDTTTHYDTIYLGKVNGIKNLDLDTTNVSDDTKVGQQDVVNKAYVTKMIESLASYAFSGDDTNTLDITPPSGIKQQIKINYVDQATSATKATKDSDGNAINTTYLKTEAATKTFLPLSGGEMTGELNMGGQRIKLGNSGVPYHIKSDGTNNLSIISEEKGSTAAISIAHGSIDGDVTTFGGPVNMNSKKITNLAAPTEANDAATKKYVDASISGGCISTTWSGLTTLVNSKKLLPGCSYRITDYTCTTTETGTQSAGHQFDILVVADDTNTLNENARAVLHEDDTYFTNCKLEAWELKYCFENNVDRFAWADTTNGKGVIYYMKDEFNNECPYDFKNIQFKNNDMWYYTFNSSDTSGGTDLSIGWDGLAMYNIIQVTYSDNFPQQTLGKNIFMGPCINNVLEICCTSNIFKGGCVSNYLGYECSYNTFGALCVSNLLAGSCYGNNISNAGVGHILYTGVEGAEISAEFSKGIIFDPGVKYIIVSVDPTDTSRGSNSNCLQNIHVHQGVAGTENSKKEILEKRNLSYQVNYRPAGTEEKTI